MTEMQISKTQGSEPLLTIEDLHTHFMLDEGAAKAVNGLSLEIPKGKTVGLVGESGCGKTVTAYSIMRLVQPPGKIVAGKIILNGKDGKKVLTELSEAQMCKVRGNEIAMIFQEPMTSLNPVHSIGNQIAEGIILHQKLGRKEAFNRAVEMLEKVRIPAPAQRAREYPHQLSGGMRQRAMIAMALACEPVLLIADEPTTALDVTIQAQVLELMKELQEQMGMTILMITHDLGVIADMADEVIIMYAGKVVERCGTNDIFYDNKHPYTKGLLDSIPKLGKVTDGPLNVIGGAVPHPLLLPKGCSFGPRCRHRMDICRQMPQLKNLNDNHCVRCWLYDKEN